MVHEQLAAASFELKEFGIDGVDDAVILLIGGRRVAIGVEGAPVPIGITVG